MIVSSCWSFCFYDFCVVLKFVAFEFDRVEVSLFPMWMTPRLFQPLLKPQLHHLTFLQAPLFDACMLMDRSTIQNRKIEIHETVIHTYTENWLLPAEKHKKDFLLHWSKLWVEVLYFRHDSRDVHTVFFPFFSRDYAFAINIFLLLLECMHFQDRSWSVVNA